MEEKLDWNDLVETEEDYIDAEIAERKRKKELRLDGHHIIPRYLGGSNEPWNLINLTRRQHAGIHHDAYQKFDDVRDLTASIFLGHRLSDEELKVIRHNNTGSKHPMFGKGHLIAGDKNYWFGKKLSPETKQKMSDSHKGTKNHLFGKKRSPETIAKIVTKKAQTWIITFPDGHQETIKNLKAFCRAYSLDPTAMADISKGTRKHHKGFRCQNITNLSIPA